MSRLNHKRGRKSNYLKSLNNDNHKEARTKCLLRDNFTCRFPRCNKKHGLEFHHIDYKVAGKELEGDNLRWCCMVCEYHHDRETGVHGDINDPWNPKNPNKKDYLR